MAMGSYDKTICPDSCCIDVDSSVGPDGMAEWLRHETSEPGVLGSNPPQVSDCPTILPGLGGYPGRSLQM